MKLRKTLCFSLFAIFLLTLVTPLSAKAAPEVDPNIDLAKVKWGSGDTAFLATPNLAYDYSFGQNWNGPPFIKGLKNNAAFPAANGTLKVAVIFMDCSDRRAEDVTQRTPVDYRTVKANFDILSPLPDFYSQASYGRLKVEFINVNALVNNGEWFKGTKTSSQYNSSMSIQANEAIAFAAEKGFDFTDINYPAVFSPRNASAIANSMTKHSQLTLPLTGGGVKVIRQYFNIGYNIWSWRRPWTVLAHEMCHTLGMIDLYTYAENYIARKDNGNDQWFHFIGAWDLAGDCNATSPDFLAWHKWKVRWLEDEQVRVVVPDSQQKITLTANAYWNEASADRAKDGIKMIYIPTETLREGTNTQTTTGYVIESRRTLGNDAPGPAAPGGSQAFAGAQDKGVLIYRIDSTGPNTAGGGHGRGGVKVIDGQPGSAAYSSADLAKACFGFNPGQRQTFVDFERNITIQVIAQDDLTDTVIVTRGDPVIKAGTAYLLANKTATVDFTLDNSIGLAAADFDISYDPALLRPVAYDFSHIPAAARPSVDLSYAPGKIRFAFKQKSNFDIADALFSLTFEAVPGAAKIFDTPIKIEPKEAATAYNGIRMGPQYTAQNKAKTNSVLMNSYVPLNSLESADIIPQNGSVSLVVLGDVTGEGDATAEDAGLVGQYINGEIEFTAKQIFCADINGDKTVDYADMDIILNAGSNLCLDTDANLVKAGNYFKLSTYFNKELNSNTATAEFIFDKKKFLYHGFTPAEGVILLNTVKTPTGVKLSVMKADYALKDCGEVLMSAQEDLDLGKDANEIKVIVDYVIREGGEKLIRGEVASTVFNTYPIVPLPGDYTLVTLSNLIDAFGITGEHADWGAYQFYDFNKNGQIDIYDISKLASMT